MGFKSEIGNKEVGSEDMDWNPKPNTSQKGPQRTEKGRLSYKRFGLCE